MDWITISIEILHSAKITASEQKQPMDQEIVQKNKKREKKDTNSTGLACYIYFNHMKWLTLNLRMS